MIVVVGFIDFFEYLVIGSECERVKFFFDFYLKVFEYFGVLVENVFVFEVSFCFYKVINFFGFLF